MKRIEKFFDKHNSLGLTAMGFLGIFGASILFFVLVVPLQYRIASLWAALFIVGSDVLALAFILLFPDFKNWKELAKKLNWKITDFWIGSVIGSSLAMLILIARLFWIKISVEAFIALTIIPFSWIFTLILEKEPTKHYSKYLDAFKWLYFWVFVLRIFVVDMGLF